MSEAAAEAQAAGGRDDLREERADSLQDNVQTVRPSQSGAVHF
jgi:hypothetical protein